MDKSERDRLRALCEKATAGPWFLDGSGICCGVSQGTSWQDRGLFVTDETTYADGKFIAAARTALPALLDALDAMEAERDSAKRVAVLLGDHTQNGLQLVAALAAAEQKAIDLRMKLDAKEHEAECLAKDLKKVQRLWEELRGVEDIRRTTVEAIVRRLREFTRCSNDWAANLIEREFLEKGGADL